MDVIYRAMTELQRSFMVNGEYTDESNMNYIMSEGLTWLSRIHLRMLQAK